MHVSPAVLITGASTGIGEACAMELDRRGWRVFAGVRSPADGERLQAQGSSRLVAVRIDVTDGPTIAAAAQTVGKAVGPAGLAGLVNNAGIVVAGPLEILPLEEIRRQLEVNVVGQIAVTQAFLPLLRKAQGRVVNIGSLNGRIAAPYLGPYAASKHALEALSDALRVELRSWGIRVALVEPGAIATPIWEKSLAAAEKLAEATSPEALALYKADLDAMRQTTRNIAGAARPVRGVVRAVVHALTARRPKTRYPVGLQTRLLLRLHKWLPDRLWDWIIRRAMGLGKEGGRSKEEG
jgi:NAD(P)-dependent dehydrogenase (short-subunit alcohol dehydrogenase family)